MEVRMASHGKGQKAGKAQFEADARPQFAKTRHCADTAGTASAEPRALTRRPDGDATFSNDPDEGAARARKADRNSHSPARGRH